MVWVRLDDSYPQHPKVVHVGPLGLAMQVAALCHANRYLTDGYISQAVAKKLLDLDEIKGVAWKGVVKRLVQAGMWREVEGGWQIHDYEEYQPTKAQVEADRAAAKERMQRVRANKRRSSGEQSTGVRANFGRSSEEVRSTPTRPDVPTEHTRAHARDPTPKPPSTPQPPTFNGRVHPAPLEDASDPDTTQANLAAIRAQHIRGPNP